MRPGARVSAAIDILETVLTRHQPVATALSDWGKAHRFAGSGDRSAIGTLIYDALRHKSSAAHVMGSYAPRALILGGMLRSGAQADAIAALCNGDQHSPMPLLVEESLRIASPSTDGAPPWVVGDYPEWLHPELQRTFGDNAAAEGATLAERAPIHVRANTLKADRDKVVKALAQYGAKECSYSPTGVAIPAPMGGAKQPHLEADTAHGKGWFEIQDEGSQIAAAMTGVGPRMQVLDLCAGAGGKTLALAATMQNTGQLYAYDRDKHQLRPIFERLKRAGVRNVQVIDAADEAALTDLGPRFDRVLVDAPCSGSGTWRRRPDAKWRLKPEALVERLEEQRAVLERASKTVKPGGRVIYVTCSILAQENSDQIDAFLAAHSEFQILPYADVWRETLPGDPPVSSDGRNDTLLLTPRQHGTDGFFIAVLKRTSS